MSDLPTAADTLRLTTSQAVVRFLAAQFVERDGERTRFFAGCLGIFGHGNVAGLGQALLEAELEDPSQLPYVLGRNEQAMVHTAAAYARAANRLSTLACTTSIGPGATNMITGAAGATINRLPVLLLPGDIFATRVASPVLQELEDTRSYDISVNDCFKPVSRFWDRVNRPEQLPASLLAAMRVLTDPAETGAVTLALAELGGDKMKSAPDRIVPLGLAARMIMAGFACGSLAPRGEFWKGAAVGATTAVAASYPGWYARITAMEEYGQTPTGLVEDAIVIAGAAAIMAGVSRDAV